MTKKLYLTFLSSALSFNKTLLNIVMLVGDFQHIFVTAVSILLIYHFHLTLANLAYERYCQNSRKLEIFSESLLISGDRDKNIA